LDDLLRRLAELFTPTLENLIQLVDILLVAYLVYRLLSLIRSTRAWRILGGIVIFVAALFLSDILRLHTLHWLLDKATLLAPVALVLLLLPELRQTLEGFARLGLWPDRPIGTDRSTDARTVEETVAAVSEMAAGRIGALIVFERGVQLGDISANGVELNAGVSAALFGAVFYHGNPLHDGAAVVRGDRIVAAACRLPLSENPLLESNVHMRHRAGVGITEQTDAIVVIVSEERGTISYAVDGELRRLRDHVELRELLNADLRNVRREEPPTANSNGRRGRHRRRSGSPTP